MIREIGSAFGGTSMVCLDCSETRGESVQVQDMKFLERVVVPRRCKLEIACGFPALRSVTFGVCDGSFGWGARQLRFESLAATEKRGPLAAGTYAFAEVACLLGREAFQFPP